MAAAVRYRALLICLLGTSMHTNGQITPSFPSGDTNADDFQTESTHPTATAEPMDIEEPAETIAADIAAALTRPAVATDCTNPLAIHEDENRRRRGAELADAFRRQGVAYACPAVDAIGIAPTSESS